MKKLTWALLSLMLFFGMGTAFAQDDDFGGGGGGGDVTISVPTLKPTSGVVKPGATIDATFADETIQAIMGSQIGFGFVIYVENDETTVLESTVEILMGEMQKIVGGDDEDEMALSDDEDALAYQIAAYGIDPESDPDDPDDLAAYMKWYAPITISEDIKGDVKLRAKVAVVMPVGSDYTIKYSEEFTADYTTMPEIVLAPTLDGMVGKNAAVTVHINDGTVNPYAGGTLYVDMMSPITVYYTIDGATEPSKAAYEAQADKENGAIKMVATPFEEEDGEVFPTGEATVMFSSAVHLKAKGYFQSEGSDVETSLFDQELTLKSEANPTFMFGDEEVSTEAEFMIGDKLVIKNPNPNPEDGEEGEESTTEMYFSFDGTTPSSANYFAEENEDNDKVFKVWAGQNIEMVFGQDETGFYAYSPSVFEVLYDKDLATFRPDENGKFSMQVFCESSVATGNTNMFGRAEMMPYGSDFVKFEFTVFGLPETVTAPTFVPAPEAGALTKGDAIKWTMDPAYAKYSERDGLVAVAYVINGADADLDIDADKLDELMQDYALGYSEGVREDGKVYLYAEEKDAFLIQTGVEVKARQIVAISFEGEQEGEVDVQFKLSTIETANYTVDASKLQKPSFKTPLAGSTVEPGSPITFDMPAEYDWSAYTNMAYILYVENNEDVELEGTAEDIMNANAQNPQTGAKAGLAYKVVNCQKDGDDLNWTKALIETQEGALKIRARLAGINMDDEVFYSDEITVSCTVGKGEGPGVDPNNPGLPETVKTPTIVPAAGEVEKGTAITFTWDAEYNEETYPLIAVAYVVNGKDEDLDITVENFGQLWDASQEEDETTVREEGVTYLYRTDVDDAYPYHIEKASTVKARMLLGTMSEEGEVSIALSTIVEAAYTIKGETPAETVAKPTFNPAAGEVEKGTKVTIACETEGAVIYYTVDGTEPTAESTEYKEAIEINEAMTIKAIAIKGDAKSEVATAAYTVKTANEDLELAGVSVYPNPSNGLFNLELPVAATVDVFMSNGMLYQRLTLAQGSTTLNIERSGIYFLRITGEGRTTVKRLIVR